MLDQITSAARAAGRTTGSVLLEALRLRFGPGRLGLSEYIDFRLYADDLAFEEKQRFGGWRAQRVLEDILIDDYSRLLTLDKVTMYALMASYRLPIPEVRAVYGCRRPRAVRSLADPAALAAFLCEPGTLPLYAKPSFGSYGRGNQLFKALRDGRIVLGNGDTADPLELARSLESRSGLGWVLQQPLEPARSIADVCGSDKVSGVRLHTFLTPTGPQPVKAIWKINAGARDSDNFHHGQSGNLLAALDLRSGRVQRVVGGVGPDQRIDPPHPRTGRLLQGFQIPHWHDIVDVALDAHAAFPGFICPGWDIAVCEDGPRLLEVNGFGDIDLSQHAFRQGFFDAPFIALMKSRGLDALLQAPPRPNQRSPENQRLGARHWHWRW